MTLKKIAVIFIIIIALGGGLFAYQKNTHKKELTAHNKQKFQKAMKAAEKSNAAGLLLMASTINAYHRINGQYPEVLMQLYPDFIPEKDFISKLNWKYELKNNTFFIQRQTGKPLEYAMGPDMKIRSVKNGKVYSSNKISKINTSKITIKTSGSINSKKKMGLKDNAYNKSKTITSNLSKSSNHIKSIKKKKNRKIHEEYTIVKKALHDDEKFLLSINTHNLYIWKTRDGIIGFSNMQYPDHKNIVIFKDKTWVEYKYNQNSDKRK